MDNNDYFKKRDFDNLKKIKEIQLKYLPSFCDLFFMGIENKTSTLTRLNYACDLKIFFYFLTTEIFEFQDKTIKTFTIEDLSKITSQHIEIFLNYLSNYNIEKEIFTNGEKGKSRKLSTIRSFLKYFYRREKINSNVATKIDMPKLHEKEIIRLENNEVSKLLNKVENPTGFNKHQFSYNKATKTRDIAIITLLLGTGIRVSECVGLNIEDLDFKTHSFKITRKGGNQTILYFSNEIAEVLDNYLQERKSNVNVPPTERALFLSLQNKRLCVKSVENLVKKYSKLSVPLKNITPHKLRSTFGTNLYNQTKDIYIVADVLGHKDVNTTKKHYAAISENSRREVANIIKLKTDE